MLYILLGFFLSGFVISLYLFVNGLRKKQALKIFELLRAKDLLVNDLLFLFCITLAAISFCFPVLWLLTSVIIGFEAGAASTISRAVGRGDQPAARRLTTDTAMLAGLTEKKLI